MFIDATVGPFRDGEVEYDGNGKMGILGTVTRKLVDEFLATHPYCCAGPTKDNSAGGLPRQYHSHFDQTRYEAEDVRS